MASVVVQVVEVRQVVVAAPPGVPRPGQPAPPPAVGWIITLRPVDQAVAAGQLSLPVSSDPGYHVLDTFTLDVPLPKGAPPAPAKGK